MKGNELLKLMESALILMANNGLNVTDVYMLMPYNDYRELMAAGNKKMYVEAVMKERYNMGRASVLSMVAKMEREIKT